MRRRPLPSAAAIAVAVALAACGSAPAATSAEPSSEPPSTAAPSAAGSSAPPTSSAPRPSPTSSAALADQLDFSLPGVGGGTVDGSTLGGRDVLVWFWAPWCPTCRAEGPAIAKIAADYRGRVSVLGLGGLSQDTGAMRDFVAQTGTDGFPQAADTAGEVWAAFGVTSQYDFALVDDSGAVEVIRGPVDPDTLRSRLDALVAS